MIKLVITDLDGTFLNSQGSFNRELYTEVKALMDEKGVLFAPCTGKQCNRVEELFGSELSKDLWILGDSALRIKHNGDIVYESLLPNKIGHQIIAKLEEIADDHVIIACTPNAAVIKKTVPKEEFNRVRGSYTRVELIDSLQSIQDDFIKITVFDPKMRCFKNVKELSEFEKQVYIVASESAWIDISNYGVHKGTTVAKLQEMLDVTKAETMAFGDGLNDVELLESADFSFAMRNAFDATKDAARYVTLSNDENGVLETVRQIVSIQGGGEEDGEGF